MTRSGDKSRSRNFTFADLFCGVGGFHAALAEMGGRAVYAREIDPFAAEVYAANWGIDPLGDIQTDAGEATMRVPEHDVLAAGFPCQTFSKAGGQAGMEEARGTLFWNIARVVQDRRPPILLLENVRNLVGPRHQHEWEVIVNTIRGFGYRVSDEPAIFSPHLLPKGLGGSPQVRERVFITATHVAGSASLGAAPVATPKPVNGWDPRDWDLVDDLPLEDDHHVEGCDITARERHWIEAWDDFVRILRGRGVTRLPGFPVWAEHWVRIQDFRVDPSTPAWKTTILRKNAELYSAHKDALDSWLVRWGVMSEIFPPSRRKFEWQAQDARSIWDCVVHLRPSGLRVKRATYLPALVAITQTSIVGPRERRISPREAARLQGFRDCFHFNGQEPRHTYKQLGNAVNVGVVQWILYQHVLRDRDILERSAPHLVSQVLGFAKRKYEGVRQLGFSARLI